MTWSEYIILKKKPTNRINKVEEQLRLDFHVLDLQWKILGGYTTTTDPVEDFRFASSSNDFGYDVIYLSFCLSYLLFELRLG